MRLRPATIDDLALLHRWDEMPLVIESDPNGDWEWEDALRAVLASARRASHVFRALGSSPAPWSRTQHRAVPYSSSAPWS